jgi:DNA ligase-1
VRAFADLYRAIDETNRTTDKVAAMVSYFSTADASEARLEDGAWAVHFLIGRRPKRLINGPKLWSWAAECAGVPGWLFSECYEAVGDLAETISLVLPDHVARTEEDRGLGYWVRERLLPLAMMDEDNQKQELFEMWSELDQGERLVFNKLITGAFRVGVSAELVNRALAKIASVETSVIAHRLMGVWEPSAEFFKRLISAEITDANVSQPYPFCLAYSLEAEVATLGDPANWHIEWKWDGIRAQLIRRDGASFVWSRGEELITDRFPEILGICEGLPDGTVLDGEIVAWRGGKPLKFLELQKRIGRKSITKKILAEVPVSLVAFDLLELGGVDIRTLPFMERRQKLEKMVGDINRSGSLLSLDGTVGQRAGPQFDRPIRVEPRLASEARDPAGKEDETVVESRLLLSTAVTGENWEEITKQREAARELNVEGYMLKQVGSAYQSGRKKGAWWKWKIDPFTLDAVLIYAQPGSGRRASLYTDYTFGVWSEGALVPIAKAYSGLSDEEIRKVDQFVRRNTVEKFGPVRTVKPELVMELAFEAIQLSSRHKSGIAVRFPRISRWRHDKKAADADDLATIRGLLDTPL